MRSLSRDTWLMYIRVRAARISRRGGNEFGCIGAHIELRDEWTSRMVCRRGGEKKRRMARDPWNSMVTCGFSSSGGHNTREERAGIFTTVVKSEPIGVTYDDVASPGKLRQIQQLQGIA